MVPNHVGFIRNEAVDTVSNESQKCPGVHPTRMLYHIQKIYYGVMAIQLGSHRWQHSQQQ